MVETCCGAKCADVTRRPNFFPARYYNIIARISRYYYYYYLFTRYDFRPNRYYIFLENQTYGI